MKRPTKEEMLMALQASSVDISPTATIPQIRRMYAELPGVSVDDLVNTKDEEENGGEKDSAVVKTNAAIETNTSATPTTTTAPSVATCSVATTPVTLVNSTSVSNPLAQNELFNTDWAARMKKLEEIEARMNGLTYY